MGGLWPGGAWAGGVTAGSDELVFILTHTIQRSVCGRKGKVVFYLRHTIMKTMAKESIRELRRILGQTQDEFAATIGAAKELLLTAAVKTGQGLGPARVSGVVDAFNE